ncbi:hypothetical protein ACQ4PT_004686 [Festuca glaucescens]
MASAPSDIALQAALDGNLSLLKKMASKVDLRGTKDAMGNTAFHLAASRGCLESCRFLVEESGIDVNAVSKTGATPMFFAAREGNVQVMRYLLDHGGDPAMPDEMGSTLLHLAALQGDCEVVRLLLSKGVPVDPVDHWGAPLHIAAFKDHVEVVKVLLEHAGDVGADVNAPAGYPASAPLIQAVKNGLTDIVKLLLEAGAEPNIPNLPVEERIADWKSRAKEAFAKEDYVTSLSFYDLDCNGAADAFRQALQLDPESEEIREALRKAEKAAEESRCV